MLAKSRKLTILMLVIPIIYTIIANYSLVNNEFLYYFIVNPLFWIIFAIGIFILFSKTKETIKLKGEIIIYSLIASLIYIGVYIMSQFFISIGENPYSQSIKGIVMNLYVYILPIVAKEYTRFKLINNVYEKDKKNVSILVTIAYIYIDVGLINITDSYVVNKLVFSDLLPIIAENILCTYVAFNKLYKPAIIYRIITVEYWLISPILPKVPWIMISVIDTVIPMMLLMYIRFIEKKKEKNSDDKKEIVDPKNSIIFLIILVIALWFGVGIFPIKPVAVATGSMENTLMVGDIAILKKCNVIDIEVGDIIQYQKNEITIIHRVISKYYENDKYFFITKGDNNQAQDKDPVEESQVLGKELFSIRFLGYPAVFINRLNLNK